jgi:hypothetical protein
MTDPLALSIPDELVEQIAARAAEIVLERHREGSAPRWLYGAKAAAEYLGWPVKRVNNRINELPHHRNGGRLIFNTAELDRVIREGV